MGQWLLLLHVADGTSFLWGAVVGGAGTFQTPPYCVGQMGVCSLGWEGFPPLWWEGNCQAIKSSGLCPERVLGGSHTVTQNLRGGSFQAAGSSGAWGRGSPNPSQEGRKDRRAERPLGPAMLAVLEAGKQEAGAEMGFPGFKFKAG